MGGFRARDADRERYVDVIEAAYVDGQLGDADRELRVSRALTAETLDELDALTRDLQNRPAPVVVAPAPAPAPAPRTRARPTVSRGNGSAGKVTGLAVAALVGLVFVGAATSMHSAQEDWATGTEHAVPWEEYEAAPDAAWMLTAAGVRSSIRRYEAEFGTTEAHELGLYPRRISAQVPVRGTRPRAERWTWDGEWQRRTGPARPTGTSEAFDLSALDVEALFDNVRAAKQDLGVTEAQLSRVVVRASTAGEASVTIHVDNGYQHSGFLETTLDGRVVRSVPHEG